jgi:ribosome biogenesis GTPase A
MLLVLNKFDLVEELVASGHDLVEHMTPKYMQNFAEEYGFIGAMSTSAKTGQGVTEAVAQLVKAILMRELQDEECEECIG